MARWQIDNAHSTAEFTVRHMMITTVRGSFGQISGVIEFDPENPSAASVEAEIQTDSISTGVADRDAHLRSADFFDVEKFPTITFKSTRVEAASAESARVIGDLTMHGVTKEVALDVNFAGQGVNPYGQTVAGFDANTKIDREEFGLTWNVALEAGGVLVSRDVKISLEVQAVLVTETETA